jgi:hypothetical protein
LDQDVGRHRRSDSEGEDTPRSSRRKISRILWSVVLLGLWLFVVGPAVDAFAGSRGWPTTPGDGIGKTWPLTVAAVVYFSAAALAYSMLGPHDDRVWPWSSEKYE